MAERLIRTQTWSRLERVLKNGAVAEAGNVACLDLTDGALVAGAVSLTLLPIGYFETSLTGDGTKTVFVQLFKEINIVPMVNSSTGPVDDGDVGNLTYLHSSFEVSMTGTGKSIAGRVWGVKGSGGGATVFVQPILDMGPQGPQGEPGE